MQPNSFDVIRIPTNGPGDVSGLMALIDGGALNPSSILAVLGKTEGDGGVTRQYAVAALCNALSSHLKLAPREVESRVAFGMSGGTEGVLSPHIRDAQIEETAKAVEAAMRDASIEAVRDVHFVQIKCRF